MYSRKKIDVWLGRQLRGAVATVPRATRLLGLGQVDSAIYITITWKLNTSCPSPTK